MIATQTVLAVAFVFLGVLPSAQAEDFPGGPGISTEEFEKGFGADAGISKSDNELLEKNRVDIGGNLWSEFNYSQFSTPGQTDDFLVNPNTLWIYLDARMKNDVRAFLKFRAIYDPTAAGTVSPITGQPSPELRTILDELKLQFQISKSVFFTVGRQKIRWGTGKFWNPTDVLNNQRFDFRFGQDIRAGVALAKVHVPVGAANFYMIEQLEGANGTRKLQHALRAEVPVKAAEFSPGVIFGAGKKPVYTFDASSALWLFDVYGEVAHSQGARQAFYNSTGSFTDPNREWTSWTTGISYDVKYSDSDLVTFGLEYFQNGLGYGSTSDYVPVLLAGGYQPFYLAKQYGMFMIYLPTPGRWEKTNLTLFNLANLSDQSAMSRFDITTSFLQGMSVTFAVGLHYGNNDGEFRLGGQLIDGTVRLMASF